MRLVDPVLVADRFKAEIRAAVAAAGEPLRLAGFLPSDVGRTEPGQPNPSQTYAEYTRKACEQVGVHFDLRSLPRLELERAITAANADAAVHGIFIYYPIFGPEHDAYLRDLVDPKKDVEGLHTFWARQLYENRRHVAGTEQKAVLPCTPLAILKLLEASGATRAGERPFAGKKVVVFNRSEIVGRPLAAMLANDGAEVTSFDVDGPLAFVPGEGNEGHAIRETTTSRAEALVAADIVITGVPSRTFALVRPEELSAQAICVNFSTLKNFEAEVPEKVAAFIPRVGPMTVTMALRNTVRLYRNQRTATGEG